VDLRRVLDELTGRLRETGIRHALIGGLALAAHGAARATSDVDLLVDGERSEDVHRIMGELGYECLHRGERSWN
jgi:predicted nucleotidyltransferase